MLNLDSVSLVCIDCKNYVEAVRAILISIQGITFKNILFFSDKPLSVPKSNITYIEIPKIRNREEYCTVLTKRVYKYVNTSHMLVIQWDGFVLNPKAWTDEFLKYDFIGSRWFKYSKNIGVLTRDGKDVGNGGFSLRTAELMKYVSTNKDITSVFPEDESLCRVHRALIESKGFKFASAEIADKFSVEYCPAYPIKSLYNGQFGFHHWNTLHYSKFGK